MNRGREGRRVRIDDQRRYGKLENSCNAKASERFHRKPYQSYTVEDYLKKMGVDVTKGVDAGGAETGRKQYQE